MRIVGDHVEETTEEARQGENITGMVTVLRVSFALAVVALAVVLAFYVLA